MEQNNNHDAKMTYRLNIRRGKITENVKAAYDEVRDLPFPKRGDWEDDYEKERVLFSKIPSYIKSFK